MGGHAMAHRGATRQPKDVHDRITAGVLADLASLFPAARSASLRSYADKADFGDADILVAREGLPAGWLERLHEEWNAHDDHRGPGLRCDKPSSPTLASFERQGLQVDIITVQEAEFDTTAATKDGCQPPSGG